ncbi:hypothetical protein HBB16_06990 [Pseudonocardia sp. MCCB 268]|nr:hypothetical protein [Pseudonocardia cytotoxica]
MQRTSARSRTSRTTRRTPPDLLAALDDLTVTSRTVVEKREGMRNLYRSVTGASDDLRAFLDANGENLIGSPGRAAPRWSPWPVLAGVPVPVRPAQRPHPEDQQRDPAGEPTVGVNITLEIVANRASTCRTRTSPEYSTTGPRAATRSRPRGHPVRPGRPVLRRLGARPGPEGQSRWGTRRTSAWRPTGPTTAPTAGVRSRTRPRKTVGARCPR